MLYASVRRFIIHVLVAIRFLVAVGKWTWGSVCSVFCRFPMNCDCYYPFFVPLRASCDWVYTETCSDITPQLQRNTASSGDTADTGQQSAGSRDPEGGSV